MRNLIIALCVLSSPAMAEEMACAFTDECIDGAGCETTSHAVSVEGVNTDGRAVTLVSDAETLRGTVITSDGPTHMVFVGDTALHLITTEADQSARYTVHMSGPMAITYHGTCKVEN